ncbi:MAG: carbohydrate kinase family protein [Alkalispirochaeta sp.]
MLDVSEFSAHNPYMDAIVIGHVCIDLTPGFHAHRPVGAVAELMRPGGLVDVAGLTVSPGGAVSNTGASLARMGMDVGLIGRVGADPLAEMLRSELASAGVRAGLVLVEDPSAGTSYSVILPIPGLDRIFLHDSGANDNFSVRDLVEGCERLGVDAGEGVGTGDGVDRAPSGQDGAPRLMHFGYPTAVASMYRSGPEPLRDLFAAARQRGMTVSVDFSLPDPEGEAAMAPWREILAEAMPLTDICFPSVEELSLMIDPGGFFERERTRAGAGAFSPDYGYALAGELVAMGSAIVAVKLGSCGLLFRWDPTAHDRLQDTGAITLGDRLPAGAVSSEDFGSPGSSGSSGSSGAVDAILVPSYPVEKIVSATGAGDTAIAGFLAALLAGRSLLEAAEMGCVAGRNAVTTIDAVSSVQPLAVMDEFRRTASHRSEVTFEDSSAWHMRPDGAFEHRVPTDRRTR